MPEAQASCPSPYDTATCTAGTHTICTTSGTTYTCSLNYGNGATRLYATYDPSHATCAQDYCVFGFDSSSNYFCCETAPGSLTAMEFLGSPGNDTVQLHYPTTELDDYGAGGQGFFVTVHGFLGDDDVSGSPSTTSSFTEILYGDAGDDDILDFGGAGLIYGGPGDDSLTGTAYFSGTIYGEEGSDELNCGVSGCTQYGGAGNDVLYGSSSEDLLYGGPGNDVLGGGGGKRHALRRERGRRPARRG